MKNKQFLIIKHFFTVNDITSIIICKVIYRKQSVEIKNRERRNRQKKSLFTTDSDAI
jgi:hypothetical protein